MAKPKLGRPPKQNKPRNKSLSFRVTSDELKLIDQKASDSDMYRVDMIVAAVEQYKVSKQ